MLYRTVLVLLALNVIALLWPGPVRTGVRAILLIAALTAAGFLLIVWLNMPSRPY
jgi:hypothetical protein